MSESTVQCFLKANHQGANSASKWPSILRRSKKKSEGGNGKDSQLNDSQNLDVDRSFDEIISSISTECDAKIVCRRVMIALCKYLSADRSSLFMLEYSPKEQQKILKAAAFDVQADSDIESNNQYDGTCLTLTQGIIGYVATTGETVNTEDAYAHQNFYQNMDKVTGYQTKSLLSMPIKNFKNEIIGVACVLNKNVGEEKFTKQDEEILSRAVVACGIVMSNITLNESYMREMKKNRLLLEYSKTAFENQADLENVIWKMMRTTIEMVKCERCSIFLNDPSPDSDFYHSFDLISRNDGRNVRSMDNFNGNTLDGEKVVCHESLIRSVINDGKCINIIDAKDDPRINNSNSDYETKNLLICPIKGNDGSILGVLQLANKCDYDSFDLEDERFLETFSVFCAMALNNSFIFEQCNDALAFQKVSLELLSYHANSDMFDADKLMELRIPSSQELGINRFDFDEELLSNEQTCLAVVRMFMDLNFVERFNIPLSNLYRWVLTVQKNYRPVCYHNWRHAFSVAQMMFAIMSNCRIAVCFSSLEMLALMVGCLSHDLDHRGLSNSFLLVSKSPLSSLYSTSTMEHHHLHHCLMILNFKGNNIFENIKGVNYELLIHNLEKAILATDLAHFFDHKNVFIGLVEHFHNSTDSEMKATWKQDRANNRLLKDMLMTVCDLGSSIKPWEQQSRVAALVVEEFYQQGDIEKVMLNHAPIDLMNREKLSKLPELQVVFLETICLPLFKNIQLLCPEMENEYKNLLQNIENWRANSQC